ncbi:odorant receptor Or2-like [Bombus flavifrons]|uniref:odorant receptor Or2-like n=1 Tax=Bombus flavifrons TaxID=103934 RepID=UPI00370412DC
MVNDNFKMIMSMQFLISTGAVCFNLYRLSVMEFGPKFMETATYTLCLLMQVFYYCWYGNEVKLKSMEIPNAVLESNLPFLNDSSKKILLLIMRRSLEPIEFTSCHVISMNLESFAILLKTSYSAYNLLQQIKFFLFVIIYIIVRKLFKILFFPFFFFRKVALGYTIQVTFCVLGLLGMALMCDFKLKKLMFPGWFPFDITSSWLAFSMTFLYQFVGLVIICNGVCIFDTLFVGLLLHICCQLEVLVYRLHNIEGHEMQSLKHCVWHHNKIFSFADMVNNFFNKMLFVQFMASAVAICFTLYLLTDIEDTAQLIGWSTYMFAGIFQTFYFCWFGNATKVKSLDISNMVYNTDWPNLSNDARKMLVVIMARSLTPVEITSAYIIPMDLESFKGLMKVTYSAYNMLLQSQSSE